MEPAMRKLYVHATLVVLAHAPVVFWHLLILARLASALTREHALLFAVLVNLFPAIALILLWANHRKPACGILLLFFVIPFAIGGYEHFLSSGPDNVFHMASGEWTLPFEVSAVLLALLELLGCWASVRILRASPSSPSAQ
jgi:hypothetical protein